MLKIAVIVGFIGILVTSCASSDRLGLENTFPTDETFEQFQKRIQPEENGISSNSTMTLDYRFSADCIGKENPEFAANLRGKCYYKSCKRVGNAEKCDEVNPEIMVHIDRVQLEKQKKQDLESAKENQEKQAKCFAGNMQVCVDWSLSTTDDYDVLGKICDAKKIFDCKTKYEKLKVDAFKISCKIKNTKSMSCEEIYKEKYAVTTVTFLK